MMDCVNELEHDFREALEEIDFSAYSPYSRPFMKALFIGQMWELMCRLHKDGSEPSMYADIEEELDGAKKYYADYKKSGEADFKSMASDELKHAGILIKKHMAKADTQEAKDHIAKLDSERSKLLAMVNHE
jgi:hypothetical protein